MKFVARCDHAISGFLMLCLSLTLLLRGYANYLGIYVCRFSRANYRSISMRSFFTFNCRLLAGIGFFYLVTWKVECWRRVDQSRLGGSSVFVLSTWVELLCNAHVIFLNLINYNLSYTSSDTNSSGVTGEDKLHPHFLSCLLHLAYCCLLCMAG